MKRPHTLQESLPGLRRIFANLLAYARKQRVLIAGSSLALIVSVAIHALEPWPLKFIFDHLLRVKHSSRLPSIPAVDALSPGSLLAVAALAIIVITGMRAIAEYLSTYGFALVANRVLTEVRANLYRHLQSLSLS